MTKILEMLNHSSASPLCGLPHLTNARSSSVNNVFIILHDAVAEHHGRQASAAGGREPTTPPAAAGRAVIRRARLSENGHRALVWHRQPRRHAGRDRAAAQHRTRKILEMLDVRKALADQGADVSSGSPEDFAAFMRNESERWGAVVKQAGIKPE